MGERSGDSGSDAAEAADATEPAEPATDPAAGTTAPSGALDVDVDPGADGPTAFMQALRVPRNARWGAAVGVGFTLVVFVFFVVLPGTYRSPLWYVGLAFVLALSMAGLVAFLLTLARAVRLSRNL